MVMPFGDINCFFYIRNSPAGHAFIDRKTRRIPNATRHAQVVCGRGMSHTRGRRGWGAYWHTGLLVYSSWYSQHPNLCSHGGFDGVGLSRIPIVIHPAESHSVIGSAGFADYFPGNSTAVPIDFGLGLVRIFFGSGPPAPSFWHVCGLYRAP